MRGPKTKMNYDRKLWNRRAMKYYKTKRAEDSLIGREINRLVQQFHAWRKLALAGIEFDKDALKSLVKELSDLRQENRFRHEFPNFKTFKRFIKDNDVSLMELEEEAREG